MAEPNGNGSMFSDTQKGLAWFISVSFVTLIFAWVFFPPVMSPESMAQLNNLVSTLVTLVVMAFGYFLGSSRSSKDKDEASAKVTEHLASKIAAPGGVELSTSPVTTTTVTPEKTVTETKPATEVKPTPPPGVVVP